MSLRIPGSPLIRIAAVLAGAAVVAGMLWWRGPDWGTVWHAFDAVKWYWVAGAIGLNLLSVAVRALAWSTVINQALEPPHPMSASAEMALPSSKPLIPCSDPRGRQQTAVVPRMGLRSWLFPRG